MKKKEKNKTRRNPSTVSFEGRKQKSLILYMFYWLSCVLRVLTYKVHFGTVLRACDDATHCANLIVKDDLTRQALFDIMDELDHISKAVSLKFPSWMSDPVHGTKTGYTKLAMKLVERMENDTAPKPVPSKAPASKKRDASPEASGSGHSFRNVRGRGAAPYTVRRDSTGSSYGYSTYNNTSTGGHPNQRGGWLPFNLLGGRRGSGGRSRWRASYY